MTELVLGDLPNVFAGVAGELDEFGLGHPGGAAGADRFVDLGKRRLDLVFGALVRSESFGQGIGFGHGRSVATPLCQVHLHAKSDRHSLVGMTTTAFDLLTKAMRTNPDLIRSVVELDDDHPDLDHLDPNSDDEQAATR